MNEIDIKDFEKLTEDVINIIESTKDITNIAYNNFLPTAENLIKRSRTKSVPTKKEVCGFMNSMFDFCGDERILLLYRAMCRAYYDIYPSEIYDYVMQYFEEYEEDKYKEMMMTMKRDEVQNA